MAIGRESRPAKALKWDTPFSLAKIWPIISHNLETVQDRRQVSINHSQEVVYELSIGTQIGDLEWPWTA